MDIQTHLDGETMHVELAGRLDAAWSGTVGKTLQETLLVGCHSVILDLAQVNYLSSAGIRVLMLLAKQLKSIGGKLHISAQSTQVREVLDMVGFHRLIEPPPAAAPSPVATPQRESWSWGGETYEAYTLDAGARFAGRVAGQPLSPAGSLALAEPLALRLTADSLALGLGSLGDEVNPARAGELLGVAGLAVCLPGDDPSHPDWLVSEGDLVASLRLYYGLHASGRFRDLLRFGLLPDSPPLPLGQLAAAALERCATEQAVLVMVAETASLVGAALQAPPERPVDDWFAFPALRDRLLFTAEPAHASETCLIVGVVARGPRAPLAGLLRPLGHGGELDAHCHAAVVPYRPVHKGLIELAPTLAGLLESECLRGVLHLLNDDREGIGAGESHLRRGAIWCAPLHLDVPPANPPETPP